MFEECFGNGPFIFRVNENGNGPQLLNEICLERGWKEYNSDNNNNNENNWNLWWRTTGFSASYHKNIYAWQYLNHIPKGASICRKDNLIRYLRCMRKVYGSIYDFSPHGYNLPLEYTKLAAECTKPRMFIKDDLHQHQNGEKPSIWICKPVAQSQGRGIFLFKKLSELNYDTNTIVQRYIERPLLIGGYKFDLRLYVCVPSYYPLTIYMYREGLARFGTDKFSLNDLKNPFRHLTNSSINKLGPGYAEMKDRVGSGCKWNLRQLRRHFQQVSIPDWLIWQKITSLVILTVLSQLHQVSPSINCFEFFGFDILIDQFLRPWLLEVNLSPSLSNDCDVDRLVKKPMLHDLFDLMGLPLYNTGLSVFSICTDDDGDGNAENNAEDENLKTSIPSVLNAAGRWRKKFKRMSAPLQRTSRTRNPINPQKTVLKLPKVQVENDHHLSYMNKIKNLEDEYKKVGFKIWGNGRDWKRAPKSKEGGWIRIWPFDIENSSVDINNNYLTNFSNISIRTMVNKVNKFTKTAKNLAKNHPAASDSQLTEFIQQELNIAGDIWLPPL